MARLGGSFVGCVGLTLALVASACGLRAGAEPDVGPPATPRTGEGRVVIVTLDGVRWQDMFFGPDRRFGLDDETPPKTLLPNLYALTAARGVRIGGAPAPCAVVRTAGAANLSLPGYLEAFTGRPVGCRDNDCARASFTVLDQAARSGVPAVTALGSWEVLGRAVTSTPEDGGPVFVSVGRTWPGDPWAEPRPLADYAAAGLAAEPWPGIARYRPDLHTARIALETFRTKRPGFMFVGLGDTDELAHHGNYADYWNALRLADTFIGDLAAVIDAEDDWSRTTVLVLADHGREEAFKEHGPDFPESGRSFMFAFGARVARFGDAVACLRDDITLIDVAPTVRVLLGLAPDPAASAGRPITVLLSGPTHEPARGESFE